MSKSSILVLIRFFTTVIPCENSHRFLVCAVCRYLRVCPFVCVRKLICVLSRSSVETDNVVYLLSSCLDNEIKRSVFASAYADVWECWRGRVCAFVCVKHR